MKSMLEVNSHSRRRLATLTLFVAALIAACAFFYAYGARREMLRQQFRTQLFRTMISTTDHGLVILDPKGRVIEWGPSAELIFGWKSGEVLGSKPYFMMPERYRKLHEIAMSKRHFDLSRQLVNVTGWAFHKDGSLIPVRIVAASFANHIGFYHVALFSKIEDLKTVTIDEKPEDCGPPLKPVIEEDSA